MMISERHKMNCGNNMLIIICCWLCVHVACPSSNCLAEEVFEVLPQTQMTTTTAAAAAASKSQDEVNVVAFITPNATTGLRLDPNNNNEWRPLGHGDPLQKDPTYDYSPPALDRVRYWAENNATSGQDGRQKLPAEVLRNKTKSEILLLGMTSERERNVRPAMPAPKQPSPYQQHLKYAPIRRSYYAPQQPQPQPQQQQPQHMPHTHLMPPPMMMKGMGHVEYRHSVMNSPSSSSYMSMNMGAGYSSAPVHSAHSSAVSSVSSSPSSSYNKPSSSTHYYSSPSTSAATSSWYSSHAPSMSSLPHRMSYGDVHHQESMQHYSFSRPVAGASYSPNSIHAHGTGAPRKPWLHELLQKELVKPTTMKQRMKPTMPATKYLMGTTKPQPAMGGYSSSTYPPLSYAPVTFVPGPPTIETPTTNSPLSEQLYVTPTMLTTPPSNAGFRPMMVTTTTTAPSTTTTARPTTSLPIYQHATTMSTTRLMIPQTSNLARRPTVAPAPELTTDALFSHYKQPPKPLMGPMYLIIEGHSKVKTYGQNELDPHSPKIVPIISKREPVVRIADPNEKRGTVETYQVKHLHTKTMPQTTTTATTTTTSRAITTTTPAPITTTTARSTTQGTTRATSTTTSRPLPSATESPPSGVQDLLSLLDNMFADAQQIVSTTAPTASTILKPVTLNTKLMPQPKPKPQPQPQPQLNANPNPNLNLRPMPKQPEPRIGSKAGSIESLLETDDNDDDDAAGAGDQSRVNYSSEVATSTEPEQPPRATRQIFDYDQLPESRLKIEAADELEYDDDGDAGELLEDGELAADSVEDITSDSEHNLLKRIDKFVDDVDDGDDDLDDLMEGLSPDDDDNDDDDEDDDDDNVDDEQPGEQRQQEEKQHKH